ncbi:MAG: hypothetical protein AAF589_03450 [Planctomycetota bacterium]
MPATIQNATVDPGAQAGLPAASTRGLDDAPFGADDFVRFEGIPVFREHTTRRPSKRLADGTVVPGEEITFGPNELRLIAERCNRRISSTGDYAVLTLGHTPTEEQRAAGAADPPVIGFAGPFQLGTIGPEGDESYVILATHYVYRDRLQDYRRHPRRSPEVWMEDDFAEMFLDPIALLGAEVPRLDMGLMYGLARHSDGREVCRYSSAAAMPGPVSTQTPGEPVQYQTEDSGMSPEDIERIVEAVSQLPVFQYMQAKMAEEQQAGVGGGGVANAESPSTPANDETAGPATQPAAATMPSTPAEASPAPDEVDDEEYQRYEAKTCGEMGDEEFNRYLRARRRRRKHYSADGEGAEPGDETVQYMAEGSVGSPDAKTPEAGLVTGSSTSVADGSASGSESYSRNRNATPAQYAKMAQELQSVVANQQAEIDALRADKTNATRSSSLRDLREQGVLLDVEEEMSRCRYGRMSDEQFAAHTEAISTHYQRMPVGGLPPGVAKAAESAASAAQAEQDAEQDQRARYSREAQRICLERPGERVYDEVLADLMNGKANKYQSAA